MGRVRLINFAGTMLMMRDSMLETVEEECVMARDFQILWCMIGTLPGMLFFLQLSLINI